jgi:hypothetical protein
LKRSPAEALSRLPSEIADLADEFWQRALSLSAQTASHDDNAARARLEQVKRENEVRSHALAVQERVLREREESRDKLTKELQEQVATLLSIVSRNTETIAALQSAKQEAEGQANDYRAGCWDPDSGDLSQRIGRTTGGTATQANSLYLIDFPRSEGTPGCA